jgi:hypothetical protein
MKTLKTAADGLPQQVTGLSITSISGALTAGLYQVTVNTAQPHRIAPGDLVQLRGGKSDGTAQENTEANQAIPGRHTVAAVPTTTAFTYIPNPAPTTTAGFVLKAPADLLGCSASRFLGAREYEPPVLVRAGRLQTEVSTPDASLYINDTAAHNAPAASPWREITALSDTVVGALTSATLTGFKGGMPLPKGCTLKGSFSSITLTSGGVIANQ